MLKRRRCSIYLAYLGKIFLIILSRIAFMGFISDSGNYWFHDWRTTDVSWAPSCLEVPPPAVCLALGMRLEYIKISVRSDSIQTRRGFSTLRHPLRSQLISIINSYNFLLKFNNLKISHRKRTRNMTGPEFIEFIYWKHFSCRYKIEFKG